MDSYAFKPKYGRKRRNEFGKMGVLGYMISFILN